MEGLHDVAITFSKSVWNRPIREVQTRGDEEEPGELCKATRN
jgi:hypothetical protein